MQAYDSQGEKIWDCELDIYGKVRNIAGGKCFVPFRYQGQYEDEETGLYYNRFRYYSPESGTYISQDPIGLAGNNPNTYDYVKDVHTWVDVFGLDCGKVSKKGKAIVIGEGMDRIKVVAKNLQSKGINAKWYQAWSKNFPESRRMTPAELVKALNRNKKWLESKIKEGYTIYDIGPRDKQITSPFYRLEQEIIKQHSYPKTFI